MNWPWSELGLDGPASLSEIRHAYADRTRVVHPEDDPEGFQRLHEAYTEARKLARSDGHRPPPEPTLHVPPQNEPIFQKGETDIPPRDDELPKPEPDTQNWDYSRIFMEEQHKQDAHMRIDLQQRTGRSDLDDDWDSVLQAVYALRGLADAGIPQYLWLDFLKSSLFERVVKNPCFLEALQDWLDTKPPLHTEERNMLLSRLRFFFGDTTASYGEVYRRLTGTKPPVTPTRRRPKIQQGTQVILLILFFTAVWGIFSLISYNLPASKAARQNRQLAQWLSQDIGMEVSPAQAEGTFSLESIPEVKFQAETAGERDPESGKPGYITNFSDVIFFFRIYNFSRSMSFCRLSKSPDNDFRPDSDTVNAYGLDFPLHKAPEFCENFSLFLEKLSREPWYDTCTPHVQIDFERCGGSYYTLLLPEGTFDAEQTAQFCEEQIPLQLCIFLMNESGLTKEDLAGRKCDLVEIDTFDPEGSPFRQFAAVDVQTKDVVRVYAYSDIQTTLISYPPEKFSPDLTFVELRAMSENFSSSGIVDISKPQIYRYAE